MTKTLKADHVFRVIVIDDHEDWRRYLCSFLQKYSTLHVISEASDGFEAVRKTEELQPDLITLDIGLPRMNGIEAARRIKDSVPKVNILFVSALPYEDIAQQAMQTGASGYVVKSGGESELKAALDAVLSGKQFLSSGLKPSSRKNS